MILSKTTACGLAVDLGLVISVWSRADRLELMRGGPTSRACHGTPDLRVWVGPEETARVEALTDDGRAFLSLVADDVPPTVRTPYC